MNTTIKNITFALAFAVLSFSSCEKAAIDCNDLMVDVSRAQENYYNDQTSANCMDYADALQAYANASCQDGGGFLEVMAQLPCKQN